MAAGSEGTPQAAAGVITSGRNPGSPIRRGLAALAVVVPRPVSLVLATLVAAGAAPTRAPAQYVIRTWLDWRTIETPRFSFHYPTELEEWTRTLAARIETIDSTVASAVGNRSTKRIEVVVDDPYSLANGSAWPTIDAPSVVFWASPPTPREDIGAFTDFGELLAVHELAHIAHLTRESRNPALAALWRLLPANLGPVARKSPRWVIEGYATYLEGKLTGSGRPYGAWRAAFLRQTALEGKLPIYAHLDLPGGFLGGEFAYLAGSAFLEWLVARSGDSTLVHVWRRMSARQDRGFDAAFTGAFGESPGALYGRFVAELTAKAFDARREITRGDPDTGVVVQHLTRSTGDPAISSDGGKVALVIRSATRPPRTVIWKTIAEPDTAGERARARLLARDSLDVPARSIFPPPKKAIAELLGVGNLAYEGPRFFRDGRILVWRNTAQGDGSYRPDLYIWDPQRETVHRVTRGASARDGDPSPDARRAIATRCAGGRCGLVEVDMGSGAVRALPGQARDDKRSYYRPRYSPDGRQIVVAVHDQFRWRLALLSADGTFQRWIGPDAGEANRFDGAFVDSTTIVGVSDEGGVHAIQRIDTRTGAVSVIARGTGAAVSPEPNPADGTVWFLSLHAGGYDLRSATRVSSVNTRAIALPESLAPSVPPSGTPRPFPTSGRPVGEPRAYGAGARMTRWAPAGVTGADGASFVLGVFDTDVVGRGEVVAQGTFGDAGTWRSGSVTGSWRGWRPTVSASVFTARQSLSEARSGIVTGDSLDVRYSGLVAWFEGGRSVERESVRLSGGVSVGRVTMTPDGTSRRPVAFLQASATRRFFGDGRIATLGARSSGSLSRLADDGVRRFLVAGSFDLSGSRAIPLSVTGSYGAVFTTSRFERFLLGGSPAATVHPALLSQRITMPALPAGVDGGDRVMTYRAGIPFAGLAFFTWGARTRHPSGSFASWHRVSGVEWTGALPAIGTAGTPAVRSTIGVGRSHDAPYVNRTSAYVTVGFGELWR